MNHRFASRKIVFGLGLILIAALAWLSVVQHATIRQLREQQHAQEQKLKELASMRADAQQAQASQGQDAEIERLREENKDLLRLRNEVHQLREQIAQTEVLRSANAGLLEALTAKTNLTASQSASVVSARKQGAVLGIQTVPAGTQLAGSGAPPAYQGTVIAGFIQGSPASQSGLKVGDIIFRIDNHPIENTGQLQAEMLTRKPGEVVTLDVMRGSEVIRVQVRTMAWPQ